MPNDVTIVVGSRDNSGLDLDKLKARLADLGRQVADARVNVKGDKEAALALDRMQLKLNTLGRKVASPKISVDGAFKARVEVDALSLSLDKLDRRAGRSVGGVGGLSGALSGLAGIIGGGGGTAAQGGAGAAGTPVGAVTLTAAITAALPIIASLGTVAIGAGTGIGAFGALALPTFAKISKGLTTIAADQAKVSAATTATAKSTALAKLAKDWGAMSPAIRGAVKDVQGFEAEFGKLAKSFQAPALQIFHTLLDQASKALRPLAQIAVDAAPWINQIAKLIGSTLVSALKAIEPMVIPAFKAFVPLLKAIAGLFLSLLRNLADHMDVWVKLAGSVAKVVNGLAWLSRPLINFINWLAIAESATINWLSRSLTDISHWWRNTKTIFDIFIDYAKMIWDKIQIFALSALHGILSAFSHIPFIGHYFRTAADDINGTLNRLRGDSARTASAIQADFDRLHGKNVSITVNAEGFWAVAKAGGHAGSGPTGTKHGAAGMLVTGGIPGMDSVTIKGMPGELMVPTAMVNAGEVDHLRGRIPGFGAGGVVGAFHGGARGLGRWLSTDMAATTTIIEKATAAATAAALKAGPPGGFGGGGGGQGGPVGGDAAANRALARRMYPAYASGPVWNAWDYLEMREAGWDRFARNSSSGAYGIPQALPPTKMPFAAQAAGGSHAGPQINWMWDYMASVYGGPIGAAAHERAFNWYGGGLKNGIFSRPTLIGVGDRGPERVSIEPLGRGGGTHVTLLIQGGSGHEFDQFMATWIGDRVRVQGGGDVQVAFGSD